MTGKTIMLPNIHDAHSMPRVLPVGLEGTLNERDRLLNRLPLENLLETLEAGKSQMFIDRGLALNAAASGLPVSMLATVFSYLPYLLLIGAIPLLIFVTWYMAAFAVLGAKISYSACIHFTKEDVGRAALSDPRLLRLLMSKGVIWFETT
jgi:hypothetical protein